MIETVWTTITILGACCALAGYIMFLVNKL